MVPRQAPGAEAPVATRCMRILRIAPGSVMKVMARISAPRANERVELVDAADELRQLGQWVGLNASHRLA